MDRRASTTSKHADSTAPPAPAEALSTAMVVCGRAPPRPRDRLKTNSATSSIRRMFSHASARGSSAASMTLRWMPLFQAALPPLTAIAVREDLAWPEAGALAVVRMRVVDAHRLARQLRPDAEAGRVDLPDDVVGRVLPGECQPVLPQRRPVPAGDRAAVARGQRHADVAGIDRHPVEDLAGAIDRQRDDMLGVDLGHGGPLRHG